MSSSAVLFCIAYARPDLFDWPSCFLTSDLRRDKTFSLYMHSAQGVKSCQGAGGKSLGARLASNLKSVVSRLLNLLPYHSSLFFLSLFTFHLPTFPSLILDSHLPPPLTSHPQDDPFLPRSTRAQPPHSQGETTANRQPSHLPAWPSSDD